MASFIPYPFILYALGLPAAISITFDTFIFPVVLSWIAEPPKNIFKGIILVLIMLFGIISCYFAITELISAIVGINQWENPFRDLFQFHCFL